MIWPILLSAAVIVGAFPDDNAPTEPNGPDGVQVDRDRGRP